MPYPPVLLLTQSDDLGAFAAHVLDQAGYPFRFESPLPLPRFLLRRPETIVLLDLPASEIDGRAIYTLLQAEFPRRLGAIGARSQIPGYCFMTNVPMLFKPFTSNDLLALVSRLAALPLPEDVLLERATT